MKDYGTINIMLRLYYFKNRNVLSYNKDKELRKREALINN